MVDTETTSLKAIFRVDASIQMGSGHVMRCLTLADELAQAGAECHFICREHQGHLNALIKERGHAVHSLPNIEQQAQSEHTEAGALAHASWLGTTQEHDIDACIPILKSLQPDWLIVDHYAIDVRWHKKLRPYCQKIMVIDDLADRQHDCDLLLDQTFGRNKEDYVPLVPEHCEILCGAQYALLRPEFAQWRDYSLQRRSEGQLEHLLINLGGVDKDNITTDILQALANTTLPESCRITVVMGATAPWIEQVQQQAALMPWPTQVKVGVSNMAELMANSDLAIGAAGATSWERCCLGLPTIMVVLASNQIKAAQALEDVNAAIKLGHDEKLLSALLEIFSSLLDNASELEKVSKAAQRITDGLGARVFVNKLTIRCSIMHRLGELRDIKDDELELTLSWRNAPGVRKNMYTQHEINLNEHLSWWDSIRARVDQKYFMYEIEGKPQGIVAFNKIDLLNQNSSWAFYASPDAAKGTGSRMEFLALEYAFFELGLNKLNCEVLAFNSPVIKLHKRFGFKVEGIRRQQYKIEQEFSDVYQLGILTEEWKELREGMLEKLIKLSER